MGLVGARHALRLRLEEEGFFWKEAFGGCLGDRGGGGGGFGDYVERTMEGLDAVFVALANAKTVFTRGRGGWLGLGLLSASGEWSGERISLRGGAPSVPVPLPACRHCHSGSILRIANPARAAHKTSKL